MRSAALVIANTSEAFRPLISKYMGEVQQSHILNEHVLGDRAALWDGGVKVVITSLPIPHAEHVKAALGYSVLENLSPRSPSPSLSSDILTDRDLFDAIVDRLAGYEEIRLVSYVASNDLYSVAQALHRAGVALQMIETPGETGQAVAKFFDTKSGFRTLLSEWNLEGSDVRMPGGVICRTPSAAAREVVRRLAVGVGCLCKADVGESGIGLLWFSPDDQVSLEEIEHQIRCEPAFDNDPIVVEQMILPPSQLSPICRSPSIEAYINPRGVVQITYTCVQLFDSQGHFSGVLIDRQSLPLEISSQMARCAESVGRNLASAGYVGYFDLDFVVGPDCRIYVVEGNPRRTGGTHAHEVATVVYGPEYLEEHVVLARTVSIPARVESWNNVARIAKTLLFDVVTKAEGIIPAVTSGIKNGVLGYVVLAQSFPQALALESGFLDTLVQIRPLVCR